MAWISRLKNKIFDALGLNEWGERNVIPQDFNTEIIETDQEFQPNAIEGSRIESLNVRKLKSGNINVDEYIQSTGFVTGSTGWQIKGDGTAEFVGITLSGGTLKYGKTSFTDAVNAGYIFDSNGMYVGAATDASYIKYSIWAWTFTIKAAIDWASTIGWRVASTLAAAIDAAWHFADSAISTATNIIIGAFTFGVSGALQIGTYVNGVSGDIRISPTGILGRDINGATTFSINGITGVAVLNWLVVGTNVGLGTAQDAGQVTVIVGNTVTTWFVNALNVNAATVSASISITTPTITGGTITIGTGDAVFIAGANGIQLGDATFADALFSVTMAGVLKSISGTIGGWTIGATSLSAVSGGNTTILSSGATAFSAGPTGIPTVTITQAGVLTATGASISGAITATSGTFTGTVNATAGKFGTSTNYWSVGATGLTAVSASTDVFINYGKTDFGQDATAGFILWYDFSASLPKLEFGVSASKMFKYDGTNLTLTGGVVDGTSTLGGRLGSTIASAIDSSGHFVDNALNTALSSILGAFTFGVSGAIQIGTYEAGVSGDIRISPTGLVGRDKSNNYTLTLDASTGDAFFAGTVYAKSGYIGSSIARVVVDSTGLLIGATGSIRTADTGSRISLLKTATGAYTHGIEVYDASDNLTFMIMADGGQKVLNFQGTDNQWFLQTHTNSATTNINEIDMTIGGLQHAISITTEGTTERQALSCLYINNQSDHGKGIHIVNDTGNINEDPSLYIEPNSTRGNSLEISAVGYGQINKITNNGFIQFPAYHHRSEFDETLSGDTALASTVIAKAYWVGSGTSGTQTLINSNSQASYIQLATTTTGSRTSILNFNRRVCRVTLSSTVEFRFQLSNITNTAMKLGFYYDASNYVYFLFDTDISASNIYAARNYGGAGETRTDTNQNLNASTWYHFKILFSSNGHAYFYMNGSLISDISTNLPIGSNLYPYVYIDNKDQAENKILSIDSIEIWNQKNNASNLTD